MKGIPSRLSALIAALTVLGLVGAFLLPRRFQDNRDRNESLAVRALLALAKGEAVYHEASGSYLGDLAALSDAMAAHAEAFADLPHSGRKAGYRFGGVEIDETGRPLPRGRRFAYYAVPETYHVTGVRTLLVDPEGLVYAKDAGSSLPPTAWPASDPTAAGWVILGR